MRLSVTVLALAVLLPLTPGARAAPQAREGWLSWRGPRQNGTADAKGLFDRIEDDGAQLLWTFPLHGRGTPVVADGRVFALGYRGEGGDLREGIVCLDELSGRKVWERFWSDFLSDIIYDRYAIGSPTVDPRSGNVFFLSSAGVLSACTRDGELLWQHSLMEEYGRLTFPNGRTGSPLVDEDRVVVHAITTAWGSHGPARDRFLAFDKDSGACVWSSTPGTAPKDSSFSMPVVVETGGRRVLYCGTGCGHVVALDARTGRPLWRYRLAIGGVNASVVAVGDRILAIHGKENVDDSTIGRMVLLPTGMEPEAGGGPLELGPGDELWRADLAAFTSSPVVSGGRAYQTVATGELVCVDVDSGNVLWKEKLAPDQLHASPVFADGKLYVPMTNGTFYVVRPSEGGCRILDAEPLEGSCLGAPAVSGRRVLVHTTETLYCFGSPEGPASPWPTPPQERPGEAAGLALVPADFTLRVGEEVPIELRTLDAAGRVVERAYRGPTSWTYMQPPIVTRTPLWTWQGIRPGTGVLKAGFRDWKAQARVRVVPTLPYRLDFEDVELDRGGDDPFAFPPSHWLSAKPKWKVVALDGNKVLTRNLSNPLFQRTLSLIGHPGDADYEMRADVMSEGNRRSMSTVGIVVQRYLVALKGNHQSLEVSSNQERLKQSAPFRWKPGRWYTLAARVRIAEDGTGVVLAKAWERGTPEPEAWTLEVPTPDPHRHGSPGLYGFTPQSRFPVYLDNIELRTR